MLASPRATTGISTTDLLLMFVGIPVGVAFLIVCTVTAYFIYGRFDSFDVSPYAMLLMMLAILLLLGMFMDQLAMMLLTVPIFFPIVAGLELGMELPVKQIWFGVIMLLAMEVSFTTPPFGLLLFVMQGVAPPGTRFGEICLAALPFMGCAALLIALIIAFPALAVWLPFLRL